MIWKLTARKRGAFLFLALLITTCAGAQINPADNLPVDPKVTVGKLENGLTYYIRQNKKPEQKVELRLVLNAGSINEDDDQQGLAHMAEHMAFNGTTHFKKNEIISFLQSIGVGFGSDLNAYTSFDETVYVLPIPTDKPGNLEKGFQILEDWAHNVTYLDEDIESERAIILEERRMGKGASDRMFRKIYPKLLAGSKYAQRLPIGIDSIISHFKPDVIRRYYKEWYRPDLMAVIVVGDIEPAKALEMVKKHFKGLTNPANGRKRESYPLPPYAASESLLVTDKEATGYQVALNYPAVKKEPAVTLNDYKDGLVQNVFLTLLNQRLQEVTQKENPPFLMASGSFGSYARGYEAFGAWANAGNGDVNRALNALAEEVERVERYGFTAAELERAKKSMMASFDRAWNNRDKNESENYVQEYTNNFLEHEPIPGIEKEYEYAKVFIPAITLDEVNAVSKKMKEQKNKLVYLTGPEASGKSLPDSAAILAVVTNTDKADIKPYEEKVIATDLIKKDPVPGKVTSKTKNTLLGTTELKLSNGVTVTLKPTDFKDDEILMAATRPGGKSGYGLADKFNVEYAASIVSSMGVGDFTPTDLRKALAGKVVGVSPRITPISDGVNGNSSVKDLETMFQLTYLYFTAPRKDTSLFRSFIQRSQSQYANLMANPQAVFVDTLYKAFFKNDPMMPVIVPRSDYFSKVNLDRSLAIYKERFGDVNGMDFVLVGSFKEEDIIPFIEKYIASLPSTRKQFAFVDNKVRTLTGKHTLTINKGKEDKSLIVAMYAGDIPYSEDLDLKAKAMSEVLNIRIIEELREKIQGIYGGGTDAGLQKYPRGEYNFVLQLPCGPEKVDTLLKAVKAEFAQIAKKGPEESYLKKVKQQWIEQHKTGMKENKVWLGQLLQFKEQGGDPKRFTDFEQFVNKLTPQDVQQAAKLILEGSNQFFAVLMPEKKSGTK